MSQDNININVDEINDIVNIVASEILEVIDINVGETTEQVTLNITEEIIQVNVNKNVPIEQVQSDWNQSDIDAVDFIKNKPSIPASVTNTSELINDGSDGVNPFITLEDVPSITIDATPTDGSTNAVSSNGVFDALATKQNSLGFTAENVENKSTSTSLGTSDTLYPTQNAVKVYSDTKFTLPSLTNGSVLFSNGTTIAQDNANFFWDDTNNRLGIGTATPAAKFHVSGTGLGGSITLTDTAITNANFNSLRLYASTQNRFGIGVGTTTSFPTQIIIDGSTSNVGISTTNPQARLDVRAQGALSTDIAFRVRNSVDTANLIQVNGDGTFSFNGSVGNQNIGVINGALQINGNGLSARVLNFPNNHFIGWNNVPGRLLINSSSSLSLASSDLVRLQIQATSGNILIGTITDVPSSIVTIESTTKGFLPPRMTNAQRLAIASPAVGLMVYCTDATEGLYINKSTGWTFII